MAEGFGPHGVGAVVVLVGTARREGTLRATVPRKFTLVDAIVLIAAVAVSLVEVRRILREDWTINHADWSWDNAQDLSRSVNPAFAMTALSVSCALCILRLRKPRPSLRRIIRQPGAAACASVVIYAIVILIGDCIYERKYFAEHGWYLLIEHMSLMFGCHLLGGPVAGAWIVLWIGRVGRLEPSWIDRAGRVLGVYWIVKLHSSLH